MIVFPCRSEKILLFDPTCEKTKKSSMEITMRLLKKLSVSFLSLISCLIPSWGQPGPEQKICSDDPVFTVME
jgi:hypothetical protein